MDDNNFTNMMDESKTFLPPFEEDDSTPVLTHSLPDFKSHSIDYQRTRTHSDASNLSPNTLTLPVFFNTNTEPLNIYRCASFSPTNNSLMRTLDSYIDVDMKKVPQNNKLNIYPITDELRKKLVREIAVFIHQGDNYSNPRHHPKTYSGIISYSIINNLLYYSIDWACSLLLLILTVIENPLPKLFQDKEYILKWISFSVQFLLMIYFFTDCVFRIIWLGFFNSLRHRLTLARIFGIFVIFLDIIFSASIYNYPYWRLIRCLRPLLFLTSSLSRNVRSVLFQLINTIKNIMDLYLFYLLYLTIFAALGYYILKEVDDNNFISFSQSFITLFALSTTVNFPDVMLPALNKSKFYFLFFFVFLIFGVYILTSLILATVKENFVKFEKDKLKQLLQFRRSALKYAFALGELYSPSGWDFELFQRVMKLFIPWISKLKLKLMFKVLDRNGTSKLTWREFNQLSNVASLCWKKKSLIDQRIVWHNFFRKLSIIYRIIRFFFRIADSPFFTGVIYLVILVNCCFFLIEAELQSEDADFISIERIEQYIFIPIYLVEFIMLMIGFGPLYYFSRGWRIFDFVILFSAIILFIVEYTALTLTTLHIAPFIVLIRTVRLIRVLKFKKSFRQSFSIILTSIPKLLRFIEALSVIFYVFAIIGMTFYVNTIRLCSENADGQRDWNEECGSAYDLDKTPPGLYYLNSFDDIFSSYITLFELMIINNFHLIMNGYVAVTNRLSYLYFILFYLFVVLVATNVTVAFILDLYDSFARDFDVSREFSIKVKLNPNDAMDSNVISGSQQCTEGCVEYVGKRELSQLDSLLLLYKEEEWVNTDEISPVGKYVVFNELNVNKDYSV